MYKRSWRGSFRRRSRNGHGLTEICVEFDSERIVRLDDPAGNWIKTLPLTADRMAYLLIDVLQWPVSMLAVADSMAPHTCLAGILFSFDQHLSRLVSYVAADLRMRWRRRTDECRIRLLKK